MSSAKSDALENKGQEAQSTRDEGEGMRGVKYEKEGGKHPFKPHMKGSGQSPHNCRTCGKGEEHKNHE